MRKQDPFEQVVGSDLRRLYKAGVDEKKCEGEGEERDWRQLVRSLLTAHVQNRFYADSEQHSIESLVI